MGTFVLPFNFGKISLTGTGLALVIRELLTFLFENCPGSDVKLLPKTDVVSRVIKHPDSTAKLINLIFIIFFPLDNTLGMNTAKTH
jgi:hypothetical protein